jgi:hypothetical protein
MIKAELMAKNEQLKARVAELEAALKEALSHLEAKSGRTRLAYKAEPSQRSGRTYLGPRF